MTWPCFLVHEINERTIPHACNEPDRDGHPERRFDLARVDTGEILLTDVEYFSGGVPVGAMWFQSFQQEKRPPKGPQDYDGYTEAELANIRDSVAKHPEWYGGGADPASGLPNRRPSFVFEDGPCLTVMTPGGVWRIDSRASNCGSPYDYEHRCWVRHGEPPAVTVDKEGVTCVAGAGSIQCGDFHGFLRDGALTT